MRLFYLPDSEKHPSEKFAVITGWKYVFELFQADPFDPRLKTHRLSGQLDGLWSFSIDYDARVVFSLVTGERALFLDIGTHAEVY